MRCQEKNLIIIRKFRAGGPTPSQTWRAFLKSHRHNTFAIDFLTVPTANFRVLYVCVMLHRGSRKMVHFSVTGSPTAKWTAQPVIEACPCRDRPPRYLLRDRDEIYGECFQRRVKTLGIEEVKTATQSPWQNPLAERIIVDARPQFI